MRCARHKGGVQRVTGATPVTMPRGGGFLRSSNELDVRERYREGERVGEEEELTRTTEV